MRNLQESMKNTKKIILLLPVCCNIVVLFTKKDIAGRLNTQQQLPFNRRHDHPRTEYTGTLLYSCDLDLDPMTLTYELEQLRYS